MTRIDGPGGPKRPAAPGGPGKAEGPQGPDPSRRADFARGLGGPGETSPADPAYQVNDATFTRIRSRIREGIAQGRSQEQILEDVVRDEIEAHFGKQASPQMAQSVFDAFQDNTQLQSLFHQLLARVRNEP